MFGRMKCNVDKDKNNFNISILKDNKYDLCSGDIYKVLIIDCSVLN